MLTKSDAMQAFSGMDKEPWDYTQYVFIMLDELFMQVSSHCGLRILTEHSSNEQLDNTTYRQAIQPICELALYEMRSIPLSNKKRRQLLGITDYAWFKLGLRDAYAAALSIYSQWEQDARTHVKNKLRNDQ